MAVVGFACIAGCGEERETLFALRYELTHGQVLLERGVELRWGSSTVRSMGGVVAIEQRFTNRDAAVNYGEPLVIVVGGETISSESPQFLACDFVTRTGLDRYLIRLARFSRRVEIDGRTVSPGFHDGTSALLCYTSPTIPDFGRSVSENVVEAIVELTFPAAAVRFSIDGRAVIPLAIGKGDGTIPFKGLVRMTAPAGARSFGTFAFTFDGTTSQIEIDSIRCPPMSGTPPARLIRMHVKLSSESGLLSVDPAAALTCCYADQSCIVTIA